MFIRLTFQPGDGIPWAGQVLAVCDGQGQWTVHQPDAPEEAGYLQSYLNARFGPDRLAVYGSWSALVDAAVNELDGEILRSAPT